MRRSDVDFSQPVRQSYVAILMIIYKYYKIIIRQAIPIVLIIVVGGKGSSRYGDYLLYGIIGLALVSMVIGIIAYFRFYFHIDSDELIVDQGIFNKKRTSIPFDRIQTINFEQNLVHQIFGVVKVEVDTAGTDKSEFKFDALDIDQAEDLRSEILERKSELIANQQIDLETSVYDEDFAENILRVNTSRLLKIGITENHIKSGALIFVFFFWIYDNLNQANIDIEDYSNGIDLRPGINLIIFLILLFFIASFIISLVRTVLTYYDLKFDRIGKGFRVTSGLFTRKNVAAMDHKIQMISFSDNLLKKILGYKDLFLKQASSAEVSNKKSIKIPGCDMGHIKEVSSALYGEDARKEMGLFAVDKRYFIRQAIYISMAMFILIGVGWYFERIPILIITIAVGLYLLLTSYLSFRKTKYGFNDEMIAIYGGTFGDKTTLFPLYKIQSVVLKQNIYQRRHHLASIVIYTASGGTSIPYIDKSLAENVMDYLLFRVESDNREWM